MGRKFSNLHVSFSADNNPEADDNGDQDSNIVGSEDQENISSPFDLDEKRRLDGRKEIEKRYDLLQGKYEERSGELQFPSFCQVHVRGVQQNCGEK